MAEFSEVAVLASLRTFTTEEEQKKIGWINPYKNTKKIIKPTRHQEIILCVIIYTENNIGWSGLSDAAKIKEASEKRRTRINNWTSPLHLEHPLPQLLCLFVTLLEICQKDVNWISKKNTTNFLYNTWGDVFFYESSKARNSQFRCNLYTNQNHHNQHNDNELLKNKKKRNKNKNLRSQKLFHNHRTQTQIHIHHQNRKPSRLKILQKRL
jgi:hypothetical protein